MVKKIADKNVMLILLVIVGLVAYSMLANAGSLEPIASPAPTMKTLQQVEPRTPIGQSDIPRVITKAGSYYLSENIVALGTGQNCITINASNVTLDLKGFSIDGTEVFVFDNGIVIDDSESNITIINGTITNSLQSGITSDNPLLYPKGIDVSDIRVISNGSVGIRIGDGSSITGSLAIGNGSFGIVVEDHGKVIDCTSKDNGGWGILTANAGLVKDCISNDNTANGGISVNNQSTIVGCTVAGTTDIGIQAFSSQVSNCTVTFCTGDGFNVSGSSVTACTARGNDGIGFNLDGGNLTNSYAYDNELDGIDASFGVRVSQCSSSGNTLNGIKVGSDCHITNNNCHNNGKGGVGAGIFITIDSSDNRIDSNNVTDNDVGIDVNKAGNFIVRNSAAGNTTNYVIFPGNHYGAIISSPGDDFTGSDTNYNPWANFDF